MMDRTDQNFIYHINCMMYGVRLTHELCEEISDIPLHSTKERCIDAADEYAKRLSQ